MTLTLARPVTQPPTVSRWVRHGQEMGTTQWEDCCFVLSRTNPTHGAAASGDVPQVSGGADAGDGLK